MGDVLVSERPGRLRLVRGGSLVPEPLAGVPEVIYHNHGGLMDVALHPDFAANQLVYLTYSKAGEQGGTTAVFRARLEGMRLVDGEDIFVADAWQTRNVNFGSRVLFDRDGFLYLSIGDRGPDTEPLAQDLTVHNGKILRLRDDGSIPGDNPFAGRAGARPEIFTYGHRNPQGMMLHPQTGAIWASEHGPLGGDEVNVILPGRNYGWPLVSFGKQYSGETITKDPYASGFEPPIFFWVPSIGISDLLIYTGDRFAAWQGELIVTGLRSGLIQRVRLEGSGSRERESMLTSLRGQFRDIHQDDAGLLYLLTREDSNGPEASGRLLRLEPVED
jgi:glucose/arabinose dehydrogenase